MSAVAGCSSFNVYSFAFMGEMGNGAFRYNFELRQSYPPVLLSDGVAILVGFTGILSTCPSESIQESDKLLAAIISRMDMPKFAEIDPQVSFTCTIYSLVAVLEIG